MNKTGGAHQRPPGRFIGALTARNHQENLYTQPMDGNVHWESPRGGQSGSTAVVTVLNAIYEGDFIVFVWVPAGGVP